MLKLPMLPKIDVILPKCIRKIFALALINGLLLGFPSQAESHNTKISNFIDPKSRIALVTASIPHDLLQRALNSCQSLIQHTIVTYPDNTLREYEKTPPLSPTNGNVLTEIISLPQDGLYEVEMSLGLNSCNNNPGWSGERPFIASGSLSLWTSYLPYAESN